MAKSFCDLVEVKNQKGCRKKNLFEGVSDSQLIKDYKADVIYFTELIDRGDADYRHEMWTAAEEKEIKRRGYSIKIPEDHSDIYDVEPPELTFENIIVKKIK